MTRKNLNCIHIEFDVYRLPLYTYLHKVSNDRKLRIGFFGALLIRKYIFRCVFVSNYTSPNGHSHFSHIKLQKGD